MRRIVLTGAIGAGKSSTLQHFPSEITCVPEPAREVLAEQRRTGGRGVPEQDPALFINHMFDYALATFNHHTPNSNIVVYDRGIVDLLVYAEHFHIEMSEIERAAQKYKYDGPVFFFPAWEAIYRTDDERKLSFHEAAIFGEKLFEIYHRLGYELVEVPKLAADERASFIMTKLGYA